MRTPAWAARTLVRDNPWEKKNRAGLWGMDLERRRKIRLWLSPYRGEISPSAFPLELVSFSGQGPPDQPENSLARP